jgi:lysophospholipase L1-like esterase
LSDHVSSAQTSRTARSLFWILVLLLLAAPLVLAEIYLRAIGLGDPILYSANSSYRYAPRPNQKHVGQRAATITLDSKGLRGTRDWTAPADGKILFIGASITWGGSYIDDKDLYSNVACVDLKKSLNLDLTCGNAGVNSYGIDNMAERIRYKDFADESAIVVTISPYNAVRGLADIGSLPYFVFPPPGPFKAVWEAATVQVWNLLQLLRDVRFDRSHDLSVAERSLGNLFAALRETDRSGRKVLIVLMPMREQLDGQENDLTRRVRAILEASKLDFLDLHQPISAAPSRNELYYSDGTHLELAGHHFVGHRIAEKMENVLVERR